MQYATPHQIYNFLYLQKMILVFFYKQQQEGDIIPTENRRALWLRGRARMKTCGKCSSGGTAEHTGGYFRFFLSPIQRSPAVLQLCLTNCRR